MTHLVLRCWSKAWCLLAFFLSFSAFLTSLQAAQNGLGFLSFTNVEELRRSVGQTGGQICGFALEGTVLASGRGSAFLFFQDASGTEVLEMRRPEAGIKAGQRIRLSGTNFVVETGTGLSLGSRPAVDADNLHSMIERIGTIHLQPGKHPLQLDWFNQTRYQSLSLQYSGPHIPQQLVPDSMLFQPMGESRELPGVSYRCFEGDWAKLPDFDQLSAVKSGTTNNLDLRVETRRENVGLEFQALLSIAEEGDYTFYLRSDDGSRLYFYPSPPVIQTIGKAPVPAPQTIMAGQVVPEYQNALWAEVEGSIAFLGYEDGWGYCELVSGENRMSVRILEKPAEIPSYLRNARVHARGVCLVRRDVDGRRIAGTMLMASWRDLEVLEVPPENWGGYPQISAAELSQPAAGDGNQFVRLRGRLMRGSGDFSGRLRDQNDEANVEFIEKVSVTNEAEVECLGRRNVGEKNLSLHDAVLREISEVSKEPLKPSLLTNAIQVQQLPRALAAQEIPVDIRGVVTSVDGSYRSMVIQDSTRAVYTWIGDSSSQSLPVAGDFCELKGVTRAADFSPVVALRSVKVLWHGQMPQPVSPTRDQLLSGSLDAQYVEIRGMVTAVHENLMTFQTAEGVLEFDIQSLPAVSLKTFLNAVVRMRGCLLAGFDSGTHRIALNQPLHLQSVAIAVDKPAPRDLFKADQLHVRELMQFDAGFDTLRRVKIVGQLVHRDGNTCYLMEGENGLRFRLNDDQPLAAGDIVEAVGTVELGGASPFLRQAVACKVGHDAMPPARKLPLNALDDGFDATMVWIQGTLVDERVRGTEKLLELQVGVKTFLARLNLDQAKGADWRLGSRLKMTGVFAVLDGSRFPRRQVSSFELLLNSPADIEVIALPPWWTLPRLLAVVTVLLGGLMLALVWIYSLRRQVERRTMELHREISERERVEKSRAIEQERSRIAQDLHDDLGSQLTEINMLAAAIPGLKIEPNVAVRRLREIGEKSRSMISSLDGVVWVINSRNNKLSSLIEYLASYAEEFLGKAEIACRVELPSESRERIIAAEMRHDVLLAFREILNNAVRHGQPTEVRLQFEVTDSRLRILVQDNGQGFDQKQTRGNGLGNMQQRMRKLSGVCEIVSVPNGGTSVTLSLPLPDAG